MSQLEKIKDQKKKEGGGEKASIFPPKLCQFDFWQTQVEFIIALANIPKL